MTGAPPAKGEGKPDEGDGSRREEDGIAEDRASPEIDSLGGTAMDADRGWHGYGPLTLRFAAEDEASGRPSGIERVRVLLERAGDDAADGGEHSNGEGTRDDEDQGSLRRERFARVL